MTHEFAADREAARARDEEDPLAAFRERFALPDAYYFDGNSLGPLSAAAGAALLDALEEWRDLAVRGWTEADSDWFHYGERLGDRLAPLVGADPAEVVVGNSTTVNIHTLVGTFLDGVEDPVVLANELDFPTDHYAIRAQLRQRGHDPDEHMRLVESPDGRTIPADAVVEAIDDDVDVVFMPSALYRSGQLFDIQRITEAAHASDALAGFDCAHTIGVVPHDLSEVSVDFAVWCSYKYLNAGPGAIAGLYVNERHFDETPALAGWWGNEKATQFEMNLTYTPASDAGAWQIGTIPIFSAAPLDGALAVLEEAGIERVREKSLALTDALIDRVDDLRDADYEYRVGTPREHDRRGGHVAVEHPDAERISLALRERGVIVDYRPPNVVRLCPSPLYTRFEDVHDVAVELRDVVDEGHHERVDVAGDVT